jgi:hypothetical protein
LVVDVSMASEGSLDVYESFIVDSSLELLLPQDIIIIITTTVLRIKPAFFIH